MADPAEQRKPNALLAMLLAWLVPGAGHVYIRRTLRGYVIFLTIAAMFWAGVAMGGVMTVDPRAERWWFVADMFTGVHGLVGWYRQKRVYDELAGMPEVGPRVPSTSRGSDHRNMIIDQELAKKNLALVAQVDTVARAYAGVAGLINLMCIFDAGILALMGVSGEPPPQAGGARSRQRPGKS